MSELDEKLMCMKGYSYQIWGYGLGHSELSLRDTHQDNNHCNAHISFSHVQYFQFPWGWTGDLVPASDDELMEIMKRAGMGYWTKAYPISLIKGRFRLYKAETSNGTIYILGQLRQIKYEVESCCN
jgi:hypothetical protein